MMIFYLVTREHADTLDIYLDTWGRRLRRQTRAIYYDQLPHYRRLQLGTYVFSDLERLNAAQMDLAKHAWSTLSAAGESVRLFNDPSKVLRREALLRDLHSCGLNPFAVFRVDEDLSAVRFPAFIRRENEHDGNLSQPVRSHDELNKAISGAVSQGIARQDLLIVEYCDTSDAAGRFRKYSVFRIGDRFIARHLLIGYEWVVKFPGDIDDAMAREEEAFLSGNPHESQVAKIFERSGIGYGRIDYSLRDGQVVTWEINTNPVIAVEPAKIAPPRLVSHACFYKRFYAAMEAIDDRAGTATIPFTVPTELMQRLGICRRNRAMRYAGMAMRQLAGCTPWRQMLDAAS
jgi:hypothetical protein